MTVRVDKVVYSVSIDGVDVSDKVALPIRCSYGYDLRIAEATLHFHELPSGLTNWSTVSISMGRVGTGTTGLTQRFAGYCYDTTWELWPLTMTVPCKGHLVLADVVRVPEDEEAEADGLPLVAEYLAPGLDLSADPSSGAAWTDADMVTYVLGECGLAAKIVAGGIGGTGKYLGQLAFDQFVWKRGQSGLQYIEALDQFCLGYRTYDTIAGIRRTQVSPRTPFLDNRIDVNEAGHLLEGSSTTVQLAATANRIVVEGMNYGGYSLVAVETAAHVSAPPGITYVTHAFKSPMIELDEPDDVDNIGLSCREVAQWLLTEKNSKYFESNLVTWQDDLFVPGDTVYQNSPHMGGPNAESSFGEGVQQSLWIRRADCEIGADGAFTQRLNLRAVAYEDAGA